MNFYEFEELIKNGENEITLNEDVIFDGESDEINLDFDGLVIDGNNHKFV